MGIGKKLPGLLGFAAMLALILDGKTALAGGRTGVELCLKTVIPSLFPFLVLSSLLVAAGPGMGILGRILPVPEGAQGLILPAFLGGYPLGAQWTAAAVKSGQISREDGERLLGFCSNAGPGFLFGMASSVFPRPWMGWALWGIHVLSAVMAAWLLPRAQGGGCAAKGRGPDLTQALQDSCRVMGIICGWVVLFRVLIAFLQRWVLWMLPVEVQVAVMGLLELTNGCFELPMVPQIPGRFVLCSGMLAFGGLCVAMQTRSVTRGMDLKYYFLGKGLQTVFSLGLSLCLVSGKGIPWMGAAYLGLLWGRRQKRSSNSRKVIV